jgi:colanic acid/amylovoran biosynthesis protein
MKGSTKVLIINAYSHYNRGDSGIIIAMIDIIRKSFDNPDIFVMSQYHEQNIDYYEKIKVKSVPPVWDIVGTKGFVNKYINGVQKVLFYKNQSIKHIQNADLVLSAGGGYLYSSNRGPLGIGFLNALFHIWLSKKLKKKTFLFPQSIGPLNYFVDKIVLKIVLDKIDLIYSREAITKDLLINVNAKKELLPDIAFSLMPQKSTFIDENIQVSNDILNIGITVLDWRFACKNSDFSDINQYLSKIANALRNLNLASNKKIKIYIFPQVTVNQKDGDIEVSKILAEKIQGDVEIFNLDNINGPKELIYLYSKMNLFIGSRMHSAIFSLAGNVPTIALAYQPKTIGTFALINMSKFVLDIKNFKEKELEEKIIQLLLLETKPKIKTIVNSLRKQITTSIIQSISKNA